MLNRSALAASTFFLFTLSGCVNTITPSIKTNDQIEIYLIDHGDHPSVLLPLGENNYVRYAYGDWRWYVEENQSLFSGARALLWPSRAAIGRKTFYSEHIPGLLSQHVVEGMQELIVIMASKSKVIQLNSHLEQIFNLAEEQEIYSSTYNLHFVTHPDKYSMFNNSNVVTSGWLEDLGFQVKGLKLFSSWRMVSILEP